MNIPIMMALGYLNLETVKGRVVGFGKDVKGTGEGFVEMAKYMKKLKEEGLYDGLDQEYVDLELTPEIKKQQKEEMEEYNEELAYAKQEEAVKLEKNKPYKRKQDPKHLGNPTTPANEKVTVFKKVGGESVEVEVTNLSYKAPPAPAPAPAPVPPPPPPMSEEEKKERKEWAERLLKHAKENPDDPANDTMASAIADALGNSRVRSGEDNDG